MRASKEELLTGAPITAGVVERGTMNCHAKSGYGGDYQADGSPLEAMNDRRIYYLDAQVEVDDLTLNVAASAPGENGSRPTTLLFP